MQLKQLVSVMMTMSAVSSILWWHHLNNMKFCQRSTCNFENNAQTDRQHCLESLCQFIDVNWNQCVSEWMSVSVSRLKFVDKVIIITKHHQFHLLVILSLSVDSSTFLLPNITQLWFHSMRYSGGVSIYLFAFVSNPMKPDFLRCWVRVPKWNI